jgi:IstB-like ATP binding protein
MSRYAKLKAAIHRLERFDPPILGDMAYVTQDQAETPVLFRADQLPLRAPIAPHHGEPARRRMGRILPDSAMTLAAVDGLVHHAAIFEMNVESHRRRTALRCLIRSPRILYFSMNYFLVAMDV